MILGMKKSKPYRRPEEMKTTTKTPVSARVDAEIAEYLEKEAKKAKISLSELVANVLEDYTKWLKQS